MNADKKIKQILLFVVLFFSSSLVCEDTKSPSAKKQTAFSVNTPDSGKVTFAPWELIIYRPLSASENMNMTRCYLKAELFEEGAAGGTQTAAEAQKGGETHAGIKWRDVTYDNTKLRRAEYEWIENTKIRTETPDEFMIWLSRRNPIYTLTPYRRRIYLDAGMAMHLNIAPGRYRFSVYTPAEETFPVNTVNKGDWLSDSFEYNTENPLKVIFVWPGLNENGFYDGSWHIGWKAPQYFPPAGSYKR